MAPRPHRDTSVPPLEATAQITSRWSFQEEVEVLPQTEPIDTLTRRELIKEAATRCMISPLVCSNIYLFKYLIPITLWWRHTCPSKLVTLPLEGMYLCSIEAKGNLIWNFFLCGFSPYFCKSLLWIIKAMHFFIQGNRTLFLILRCSHIIVVLAKLLIFHPPKLIVQKNRQ